MRTFCQWAVVSIVWCPLIGLLCAPGVTLDSAALSLRQCVLLGHTFAFTSFVAIVGTGFGVAAALALWQFRARVSRAAIWLLVALVAIPGTVTATAWMTVFARLGLPTQGWIPTSIVQILVLLPIATGIILSSLRSLDGDMLDAARCARSPSDVLVRIILPAIALGIGASFSVLAILTLSDFTIPSLFSVNVYSLDIFSQFSTGANPAGSAWPLLVVGIPLGLLISVTGRSSQSVPLESFWAPLSGLGFGVLCLQVLVVLVSLSLQVGSLTGVANIASHGQREGVSSVQIAVLAGTFTIVCALPFAGRLSASIWTILVVAAALPASLVGIGLSSILNRMGDVGQTLVAPVFGMVVRFLPISVIAVAAFASRVDKSPLEAARIFMRPGRFLTRIWIPLLGPSLVASACVVAALSLNELGATLILIPPGASTLSIRLYNMLHYGASDEVAGLSLEMVFLTLILSAALTRRYRWRA